MKRGILIPMGLGTLALVTLAGPPAARAADVVESGTAASCTDGALNTALAGGGNVQLRAGYSDYRDEASGKAGVAESRLRLLPAILLGRDEVLVPVESKLSLLAQPVGDLGQAIGRCGDGHGKTIAVLQQQAADVMPLRRLDADEAQDSLQDERDQLLRLSHDVGIGFVFEQRGQGTQSLAGLLEVALASVTLVIAR